MARKTTKSGKDGASGVTTPGDAAADDQANPPAAEAAGDVSDATEDESTPQKKELSEIADQLSEREAPYALSRIEYVFWRGEKISRAWVLCKEADCGYKGATQNARFGRWFDEAKFAAHLPQRTAHNSRVAYEKFGHLETEVIERIGLSNCYALSSDDDEWTRNAVIERAQAGERFTVKSVQEIRRQVDRAGRPREQGEAAGTGGDQSSTEADELAERFAIERAVARVARAGNKLPTTAAKIDAISGMGISFSMIVEEMIWRSSPSAVANEVAEVLQEFDLWDLVNAADPERELEPQD